MSGLVALLAVAIGLAAGCAGRAGGPAAVATDILLAPDSRVFEGRVPRHATLQAILRSHELSETLIAATVEAARSVYDLRRLRTNNLYTLERTFDGWLRCLDYEIDADRFLRVLGTGGPDAPALTAEIVPYRKERSVVALRAEIDRDRPSLYAAVTGAGEAAELAMMIADVFAGEVDFHSDLQPGDSVGVAVEKVLREGEPAGYGEIVAAELSNAGQRLRAIRFTPPDGKPGYYDEHGRSLRRFFLKSPLKFDPRVTSGFSHRRLHPVLRTYRPHLGVDYRAPHGAPVVSVGTGVVVSAGFDGEAGLTVRIRHANGYESSYLHLSSVAAGIRAGTRVAQGDLIGRVGSTGLATAPHLDYRIRKNGVYVDPRRVHRTLPPGEPVPAPLLTAFEAERDRAFAKLVGAAGPSPVVAAAAPPAGGQAAPASADSNGRPSSPRSGTPESR